jgi:hypothetical protein
MSFIPWVRSQAALTLTLTLSEIWINNKEVSVVKLCHETTHAEFTERSETPCSVVVRNWVKQRKCRKSLPFSEYKNSTVPDSSHQFYNSSHNVNMKLVKQYPRQVQFHNSVFTKHFFFLLCSSSLPLSWP